MPNVFEFLGLSADHRKESKVVQLVKHMDEVPEKKIKYPLIGQLKKDGVYCMIVKKGDEARAFSRTGREFNNLRLLCSEFEKLSVNFVVIGELCCDSLALEVTSSIVSPNRKEPLDAELACQFREDHKFYVHDRLTLEEFIAGESECPYSYRFEGLQGLCAVLNSAVGKYGNDRRTLPLAPVEFNTLEEVEQWAKWVIEDGGEGIVLKQDVGWVAGHKGHHAMKRVRRVTYDLLCVGKEEGKGKRAGMVANLFFRWKDGKTIKADLGKGWSDTDRTQLWHNPEGHHPVGSIFEVYGLMDSSKGVIRLPKAGELRHDKTEADY